MAKLTQEEKDKLGPLISPFERSERRDKAKGLRIGEKERFEEFIHDGEENGTPRKLFTELTSAEVKLHIVNGPGRFRDKCFLWVIDDCSIKIIREVKKNRKRRHDPVVCHTNLTGGEKAFIGGEMFFCEDGSIYINPYSDRYGNPSESQWQAALQYLNSVGYDNLIDITDLQSKP